MFGFRQNADNVNVKTGSTSKETNKGGVSKKENLKLVVTETYADVLMDDESEFPQQGKKPMQAMVVDVGNPDNESHDAEGHTAVKTNQKFVMGNESSSGILTEVTIDESPILTSPLWSLHHAQRIGREDDGARLVGHGSGGWRSKSSNGREDGDEEGEQLSVFVAKSSGKRDKKSSDIPVEPIGKNLKLYRHPKILRFVSCCCVDGKQYLFAEKVSPLTAIIKSQSPLQICLGLRDVAEALQFLQERGGACHNNVSLSSVFVAPEGARWRLGGMEFVKRFQEESQAFLDQCRPLRCPNSISPEEKSGGNRAKAPSSPAARDVYAFGQLAEQVIAEGKQQDPSTSSFLDFVHDRLCNPDPSRRPVSLVNDVVLAHPYFTDNDYIQVHAFLDTLPIRSDSEKADFFSSLLPRLFAFPPQLVALQLAAPLLSRYVLLNDEARAKLLPSLLIPATHPRPDYRSDQPANPVIPETLFQEFVVPILVKVWHVRELKIRTVLLENFRSYFRSLPEALLEKIVLPQLLLGVRDTNDALVAATLRALADLVEVLGAKVVVGGSGKARRRIFADGSPGPAKFEPESFGESCSNKIKKSEMASESLDYDELDMNLDELPMRRSPVGAERDDDESTVCQAQKVDVEEDNGWDDDWGAEEEEEKTDEISVKQDNCVGFAAEDLVNDVNSTELQPAGLTNSTRKGMEDVDVDVLDVKVWKRPPTPPELDFFSDMTPNFSRATSKSPVQDMTTAIKTARQKLMATPTVSTKFSLMADNDDAVGDGWGDEGDWGNDDAL